MSSGEGRSEGGGGGNGGNLPRAPGKILGTKPPKSHQGGGMSRGAPEHNLAPGPHFSLYSPASGVDRTRSKTLIILSDAYLLGIRRN